MVSIIVIFLLGFSLIPIVDFSNNQAEKSCAIKNIYVLNYYFGNEMMNSKKTGLKCDIKNSDFTLDVDSYNVIAKSIINYQKNKRKKLAIAELNWPSYKNQASLLNK